MTDFPTYEKRLEYLLWLIEKHQTGSLEQLASKLKVSKRTVKRMICHLRDKGYKVSYCRTIQSYRILE